MAKDIIFVTGFFGAPVKETAEQVAMEKGFDLLSLDDEIERSDGRSILRICMIMGEHEYRNKEYEMLVKLTGAAAVSYTHLDVYKRQFRRLCNLWSRSYQRRTGKLSFFACHRVSYYP